jgi:hypothetical protein
LGFIGNLVVLGKSKELRKVNLNEHWMEARVGGRWLFFVLNFPAAKAIASGQSAFGADWKLGQVLLRILPFPISLPLSLSSNDIRHYFAYSDVSNHLWIFCELIWQRQLHRIE